MLFIMYSLQKYVGRKRARECYEKSVLHNIYIYIIYIPRKVDICIQVFAEQKF